MKKQLVILTKSARHGGYCVAGIDLETNKFIRLISNNQAVKGSLTSSHMRCDDSRYANILDVVEVDLIKPVPTETHPEDWLIDETKQWKNLGKFKMKNFNKDWLCSDEYIFVNNNEYISLESAKLAAKSIIIALVKDLKIYQVEYNGKNKQKADFVYRGEIYEYFSITDFDFFDEEHQFDKALVVVSLPNDEWSYKNDRFYKFVAKVFPIKNAENNNNQ